MLLSDISSRVQKPSRSFAEYITHMKSLFNCLTIPMAEPHKMFLVQNNLLPKYAIGVAPLNIHTLDQLSDACRRIDGAHNRQTALRMPFQYSLKWNDRPFYKVRKSVKPVKKASGSLRKNLLQMWDKRHNLLGLCKMSPGKLRQESRNCRACPRFHLSTRPINKSLSFSQPKIIKISKDNRPYAEVEVAGMKILGLLDSGVQCTVAGKDFEEMIGAKLDLKPNKQFSIIKTADGTSHPASHITYNDHTKVISALFVPSISRTFF